MGGALLISLEGLDGTGKTTQLKMLSEKLAQHDIKHLTTREPGGTDFGKEIRKLLLEGEGEKCDAITELLLFSADRHEHLRQKIIPALAEGTWVLTDRFADSTTVFQSFARGLPLADVERVHNIAIGDHWPHLTLILDLPIEVGLARKNGQFAEGLQESRMENLGTEFHQKVREGFHALAQKNPQRCHLIDAQGSPEEIHAKLWQVIETYQKQHTA